MSTPTNASHDADERLRRVEAVTDAALAHLDIEELMEELLDRVRALLQVDTAAVLLLDASSQQFVTAAARGLDEDVRQGLRIPVGRGFAGRIAAEKQPVVIDDIDRSELLSPILRQKGIRSLLGAPLLIGGTVTGVIHVGTFTARQFTDEEVALLQLVADRAALANQAHLSRGDRAAAAALQRSLVPAQLPAVAGFELAARYVAGQGGRVGGDWYDVFVLPSGRLCITVGDVAGAGFAAAAVMGRLRSALRAYALDCDDPSDVLTRLDRKVQHFEPGVMATVLYAVIEPPSGRLQLSVAGHPVPVLALPDRDAILPDLPIDLPLGVRAERRRRRTSSVEMPAGAVACFYTDGLVERRDSTLDAGLERLRRSVIPAAADSVCTTVMNELVGSESPADDIALLALRRADSCRIADATAGDLLSDLVDPGRERTVSS